MSAVAVVNPRGGGGRAGRLWPEVRARLLAGGIDAAERVTTRAGDGTRLAREAVEAGATAIVAVGGDGTANEVVDGMLTGGVTGSDVELLYIPAGTGSDLARTLGIPRDPLAAADAAGDMPRRRIDVGVLDFHDHAGRPARRHFVNIADAGIGGLVVTRVNTTPKILGGRVSFLIGTMRAIASFRPVQLEISLDDGRERRSGRFCNVVVANCQYF